VAKIANNILYGKTKREIKNWNSEIRTSDGPQTTSFIDLSDIEIPYDSFYTSRIILPAYTDDFLLNYNSIEESTFLLLKVTYNGNYDNMNEDAYDPYYFYEPSTYNINYYYDSNSGTTYPIGRLLLLNGSFSNKLGQIYLNNPLDYDVVLDVMQANIEPDIVQPPNSAITISNLYYNDIITNQVDCYYTGLTTGSTSFIINEYKYIDSGYTYFTYNIPYNTITSLSSDTSLYCIYLYTNSNFYTIKFLTQNDYEIAYIRMLFVFISYSDNSCRYLTNNKAYLNGNIVDC
jgi:hypothetical protein